MPLVAITISKLLNLSPGLTLGLVLDNFSGYILGYLSGAIVGTNTAKKRTLAIEVGVQNAGLATGLSTKFFPTSVESAVVAAVATIWHSVSGSVLANLFIWWDKRKGNISLEADKSFNTKLGTAKSK